MKKIVVNFICLLAGLYAYSQNDSIVNSLGVVIVVATKKDKIKSLGQKKITLSEDAIKKNPTTFTSLLRYNSPIVFKDYGNGGTSSARFRGTEASNTVVLWNGISINSVGSGQTDFNAISANTADEISIKSGGGSVHYGSGAIGGTVHLKDILNFNKHEDYQFFSSYGSFNTSSSFFKSNYGTGKWALKLATSYNVSDNDYAFVDDRYKDEDGNSLKNENGNYVNYSIDFSIGYKISDVNKIYFYTTGYYGDRLFSDGIPNPSAASERNEDFNQRNLLKWSYIFHNFSQTVKAAYLIQEYRFYKNKDAYDFDYGLSKRVLFDYSLSYRFSNILSADYFMLYENTQGESKVNGKGYITNRGDGNNVTDDYVAVLDLATNKIDASAIPTRTRKSYSIGGELLFKPNASLISSLGIRNESNSDFDVPLTASFSIEQKIKSFLALKGNISSNYRVPTYNEMYWPDYGNLDLIPERSKQAEIGIEIKTQSFKLNSTLFFIDIKDKILWKPAGNSNLWRPSNIDAAVNKGAEFFLSYSKTIEKHFIHFSGNYTYTMANDATTNRQLSYAPKHLLNYNLEYGFDRINVYLQSLYQSRVYTNLLENDRYSLDPLYVLNSGLDFSLYKKNKNTIVLGVKVSNLFNERYYFTNLRPMPGRNYSLNINYKF